LVRFGGTPRLLRQLCTSAIPPGPAVRPMGGIRPIEASKAAVGYVRNTSIAGVPLATTVGPESAHLRRPRTRSATSAIRRLRPSAARARKIRRPPEGRKFPQGPGGNQDSERCTWFDKYPRRAAKSHFSLILTSRPLQVARWTLRFSQAYQMVVGRRLCVILDVVSPWPSNDILFGTEMRRRDPRSCLYFMSRSPEVSASLAPIARSRSAS